MILLLVAVYSLLCHVVSTTTSQELTFCAGFDNKCQCSQDLKEFSCRAAGFLNVPINLPSTIVKL